MPQKRPHCLLLLLSHVSRSELRPTQATQANPRSSMSGFGLSALLRGQRLPAAGRVSWLQNRSGCDAPPALPGRERGDGGFSVTPTSIVLNVETGGGVKDMCSQRENTSYPRHPCRCGEKWVNICMWQCWHTAPYRSPSPINSQGRWKNLRFKEQHQGIVDCTKIPEVSIETLQIDRVWAPFG